MEISKGIKIIDNGEKQEAGLGLFVDKLIASQKYNAQAAKFFTDEMDTSDLSDEYMHFAHHQIERIILREILPRLQQFLFFKTSGEALGGKYDQWAELYRIESVYERHSCLFINATTMKILVLNELQHQAIDINERKIYPFDIRFRCEKSKTFNLSEADTEDGSFSWTVFVDRINRWDVSTDEINREQ